MNYSKMKTDELKAICKEKNIKGYSRKNKEELIEMIKQRGAPPVSAPKIEAETDGNVIPPVKVDMNWIPWSEKSKNIPFESTIKAVGHGEQKVSWELNTAFRGQNSSYDMMPILNGIKTKCEVKKLDAKNDFNTAKEGRDVLRRTKVLHTTLLDSLNDFIESDLFTPEEKATLVCVKDVSPDEVAEGTQQRLIKALVMLNTKRETLRSMLPSTINGQTKEVTLDKYYMVCKILGNDFPLEYSSYIDTILILQKLDHIYIDEPSKFMEDLHALVGKLFVDTRIILVDKDKGYMILPDANRIRFLRITRGNPRFQVMF